MCITTVLHVTLPSALTIAFKHFSRWTQKAGALKGAGFLLSTSIPLAAQMQPNMPVWENHCTVLWLFRFKNNVLLILNDVWVFLDQDWYANPYL